MLGDWLFSTYHNKAVKVESINQHWLWVTHSDFGLQKVNYDEVQPIEITHDIVERNGFKYTDGPYFDYELKVGVVSAKWDGTMIMVNDFQAMMVSVSCKYIHELQHIFRFCGIEQEVTI